MNATDERSENMAPPPAAQPQPAVPPAAPQWKAASPGAGDPRRRHWILACMLSIMPGLGQVYIGYYRLGFIHISVAAGTIALLNTNLPRAFYPLLGLFLGFFWLYNIVDAGRRAVFYNQALAGVGGEQPPLPEMTMPGPGGSLVGGAVLIAVGAIMLSNTVLGFSLWWLEEWWPVAPILFGVYLLVRGLKER